MFNRIFISFSVLFFANFAQTSSAFADMDTMSGYDNGAQISAITGQVKFEKRFTRVIGLVPCPGTACQHSEAYWSVVIQSGETKYILDERLNLGESNAPESVNLAGATLRPGSIVEVEGFVLADAPNLFSLKNVQKVTVVMDLMNAVYPAFLNDNAVFDNDLYLGGGRSQSPESVELN